MDGRGRLRILAVDDDARTLETLEFFLEVDGHEIYTASRGHEAVKVARRLRLERKRVDLSILDYHMPDQTGIDTFLQLSSELPGLEAVFVTGEVSETVERGISEVGGLALVPKPVDLIRMRTVIDEFRRRMLT